MIRRFAAGLALFMLASPSFGAQRTPIPESTPSAAGSDWQFVPDAAAGGAAEIALAKLALETSSTNRIKSLAQRLLSDHDTANQQLRELATLKQVTRPAGPDEPQNAIYDRLSMQSGSQFDRVFLAHGLGGEAITDPRSPLNAH